MLIRTNNFADMCKTGFNSSSVFAVLFALLLFSACEQGNQKGDAFFGGEILNPKTSNVYIYRDGEPVDTLELSEDNKFELEFHNIKTGMYSFMHGNEYQLAIVAPGDSIVMRVNTIDFDQSLVYMGEGAKKNNFLVQLFLVQLVQ